MRNIFSIKTTIQVLHTPLLFTSNGQNLVLGPHLILQWRLKSSLHLGWPCAWLNILLLWKKTVRKYFITSRSVCHTKHIILKIVLARVRPGVAVSKCASSLLTPKPTAPRLRTDLHSQTSTVGVGSFSGLHRDVATQDRRQTTERIHEDRVLA